jgi:carboxyl-terminal processing protease
VFLRASAAAVALLACSSSNVGSVGAVLGRDNETGAVIVRETPPGMAASDAGIIPGDEIVMVDGRYVRDLTVEELRRALRGEIGSTVELTIVRGGAVKRVNIQRSALREKVQQPEQRIEE